MQTPPPGSVLLRLPLRAGLILADRMVRAAGDAEVTAALRRARWKAGRWRLPPEASTRELGALEGAGLAESTRFGGALTDFGVLTRLFVLGRLACRVEKNLSDSGKNRLTF